MDAKNKLIRIQKTNSKKNIKKQPQATKKSKKIKTYIITTKDLIQYCKKCKKMHQLYALVYSYRFNKYFWSLTPKQSSIINHIIAFEAASDVARFNNILDFSQNYINILKKHKIINNIPVTFIYDEMIPYNIEDKENHSPIKGAMLPPNVLKTINPYKNLK